MQWKIGLVAAFAVVATAGGWRSTLNPVAVSPAFAKCDPEDRIDGSTANDAKRKMEAAGYTAVLSSPEYVFIDDQPVNLAGAEEVGLTPVRLDPTDPAPGFRLARTLLGLPQE